MQHAGGAFGEQDDASARLPPWLHRGDEPVGVPGVEAAATGLPTDEQLFE